ncbi:MAG: SPOR domain-containing protein [Gammaproteobacteria bacterium]|nr:SPOR domain-containing protein [Gammaproteobacteria bacterium]MCW8923086.1 SPOR domain-containing protein [Gammaproteobacteria bacterium]
MEIRKIQGVIISSLLMAGLAGCSSSSSWNRGDDSPWRAKHEAERANVVAEDFVEVSVDEAVETNSLEEAPVVEETMAEPEMVEPELAAQPELESVSDFEAEPVPVESMSAFEKLEAGIVEPDPVVEEMPAEIVEPVEEVAATDISAVSSKAYAVQVYAGKVLANVNRYKETHGLDSMEIVKTDVDGEIFHVLVGIHDGYSAARQAAADIEESTGSKPWIRSVSGLQKISVE